MLRVLVVGLGIAMLLIGYQAAAIAASSDSNTAVAKPAPSDSNAAAPVRDSNEMLVNGNFADGIANWILEETGATGKADVVKEGPDGKNALRMKALTVGENTWGLQIYQTGMSVKKDKPYVLKFWAKSDPAGSITVNCMQNHEPWDHQTQEKIQLSTEWQQMTFKFVAAWDDDNVRISFTDLATAVDQVYWFADCSLMLSSEAKTGAAPAKAK
jgi:hypothetical protein